MAKHNKISDPSNLKQKPVYIASFEKDKWVLPVHQEATRRFFDDFHANINWHELPISHTQGMRCDYDDSDDECQNGIIGDMLRWVTTNLKDDAITDW